MEPAQMERTPFADLDKVPADMHAMLFAALEAMGRHPQIQRVRRVATEALRPMPGQRLLDAGAGTGDVARQLAAAVTGAGEVVALDFSETFLAGARDRHDGSSVRYVTGDVSALDFPDETFDGVWCERVLQHVTDADAAIGELARVTRPGGRVCLIDTDWLSLTFDGVPDDLAEVVAGTLRETMPAFQNTMGRTLRRRLVRAGLGDVEATPVACYFGDPASAAVVLPMVNPAVPRDAFLIPDDGHEQWLAEVARAGERGEFLAVLTIWVACGVV
jgi:2-polyprenyl-3-methyl-5-hydroxy-6-metoxy-1,4-benzoquinol methylase